MGEPCKLWDIYEGECLKHGKQSPFAVYVKDEDDNFLLYEEGKLYKNNCFLPMDVAVAIGGKLVMECVHCQCEKWGNNGLGTSNNI